MYRAEVAFSSILSLVKKELCVCMFLIQHIRARIDIFATEAQFIGAIR